MPRRALLHLGALALIAALAAALYLPYLGNALVFDDHNLFTSLAVYDFAQQPYPFERRALPYFTLGLTQVLFNSIEAQRVVNLCLHVLCGWAIYIWCLALLRTVSQNPGGDASGNDSRLKAASLAAASLFVVHPVVVYGAGYLIERTILFATFFSLISLFYWHRALAKERYADVVTAALFYCLAVFSKEHSVLIPAVGLLLVPVVRTGRAFAWRAAILYLALCAPSAIKAILFSKSVVAQSYEPYSAYIATQIDGIALTATAFGKWLVSAITQMGLMFRYAAAWLLPNTASMSADVRIDFAAAWTPARIVADVIGFLAVPLVAGFLLRRKDIWRLAGFALGMGWILFAVELATIRFQEPFVLYRSYLWAPGLLLVVALLLTRLRVPATAAIAAIMVALLVPLARDRLDSFRSEKALWEDAATKLPRPDVPGADRIYYNRGGEYSKSGRQDEALADLNMVVKLNPEGFQGYLGRGLVYLNSGKPAAAEREFRHALELRPEEPFILMQLAMSENALGRKDEAVKTLQKAAVSGDRRVKFLLNILSGG